MFNQSQQQQLKATLSNFISYVYFLTRLYIFFYGIVCFVYLRAYAYQEVWNVNFLEHLLHVLNGSSLYGQNPRICGQQPESFHIQEFGIQVKSHTLVYLTQWQSCDCSNLATFTDTKNHILVSSIQIWNEY